MGKTLLRMACVIGFFVAGANNASAQLRIEITEGAGSRTPVAVVPFGWQGDNVEAPFDIAEVIAADLQSSILTTGRCWVSRQWYSVA